MYFSDCRCLHISFNGNLPFQWRILITGGKTVFYSRDVKKNLNTENAYTSYFIDLYFFYI